MTNQVMPKWKIDMIEAAQTSQAGRWIGNRVRVRHQYEPSRRACRRLLQQARHVRAMDQGRQGSDPLDAVVMPDVRGQRRAAPASCTRLQSWQLSPHACNTGADQGL